MKNYISLLLFLILITSCTDPENDFFLSNINLSQEFISIQVNEQATISILEDLAGFQNEPVISWETSDPAIVRIDNGLITGLAAGRAIISATVNGIQSNSTLVEVKGVIDLDNDVYIVGTQGKKLVYWKNGIIHEIKEAEKRIIVNSIRVENGDVYIAGVENYFNGKTNAKYWKNDVEVVLSNETSVAKDLFIWQNDVYVVGYQNNNTGVSNACIWKNGVLEFLDDGGKFSIANSIEIVYGNILISGYISRFVDGQIVNEAKYWFNGEETILSKSSSAEAVDIILNDTKVYCLVNDVKNNTVVPTYWVDAQNVPLTELNAVGKSMVIVDDRLYIAGRVFDQVTNEEYLTLWFDETESRLSNQDLYGEAVDIALGKGDIYILGNHKREGTVVPSYWKNGVEILFTPANISSYATALAVVPK
jgi:hypothetical protein